MDSVKIHSKLQKNKPRIILFLGAGASSFAGYYTFVSFPELLFNSELRHREKMPSLPPNTERILNAIKGSLERNNKATTHDNFLWRLDSYTNLLNLNQSDDVLQDFLRENTKLHDLFLCTEQAINQISGTTVHHYSVNRVQQARLNDPIKYEKMKSVFELYSRLANFNEEKHILPIYTTNYDLLLEDLSSEFSSKIYKSDFLTNGISNNTLEESIWSHCNYNASEGLKLFRLHGCVCWFYHNVGDNNVYFHRRDAIYQEMWKMCAMYPGKETQRGMNPHGFAFNNLYRSLQSCDLAVFIGFSFRDDDVMHVLLKALSERIGKPKLLIIDPLYNNLDIINRLHDSSSRTVFPSKTPNTNQIKYIQSHFGEDPQDLERIMDTCRQMLNS